MATKPTAADASWGTDTNFSTGPEAGNPVKSDPPSGVKAQGWRPGDALGYVGAWFNFWMNQVYLWILYLSDLHNSADFLNKTYAWVAAHTWTASNGTRILDVTQSGAGGVIRATANNSGDALTVVQNGAGRAIHATGNVRVETGNFVCAAGNFQANSGDYVYGSGRSRTKLVPLLHQGNVASGGTDAWEVAGNGAIQTSTTNSPRRIPIDWLPDGAIVTQMRVLAFLPDAATPGLRVDLHSYRKDDTVPRGGNTVNGGGALASVELTSASAGAADQSLGTTSATAHAHDAAQDYVVLQLISPSTISTSCVVTWVELTYNILKLPDR